MKGKGFAAIITICSLFHSFLEALDEISSVPKAFQVATFSSLLQGVYDGDYVIEDLKKYGDFGIGAMNSINGEFIALDGVFYQFNADGKTTLINKRQKTPFACVCFFKPGDFFRLKKLNSMSEIAKVLIPKFPLHNNPYAIKLEGTFSKLTMRALKAQNKPYKPLAEAMKEQSEYELTNAKGTIVGFWFPKYFCEVNVPEFHFHFLSEDKKIGGHILKISLDEASATTMAIGLQEIYFPSTRSFSKAELTMDIKELLKADSIRD